MKNLFALLITFVIFTSGCAQEQATNSTLQQPHVEAKPANGKNDKIELSEEEWKKRLTEEEYYVLRKSGTERAFSNAYWNNKADGIYLCGGCQLPLFSSETKFRSGTGWPSFYMPLQAESISEVEDHAFGVVRTEVKCARCGGHLGHVFPDGPEPTGLRYCLNSAALDFSPAKQ